jgi:hypothetical protein
MYFLYKVLPKKYIKKKYNCYEYKNIKVGSKKIFNYFNYTIVKIIN